MIDFLVSLAKDMGMKNWSIIGPLAVALGAAAWLVIRYLFARRKAEHEIAQEYSSMKDARETMWRVLREAYGRFRAMHPSAPVELQHLLTSVGMPPDVGKRTGRDLILWPLEHVPSLTPDERLLWEFVSLVYPPRNGRSGDVTDYSFVEPTHAVSFHSARGKLAHFWSRAGRLVRPQFFVCHYQSALDDLILLSWFDIALKQWTLDKDEGKVAMFKIGNAIAAHRRVGRAS